MEETSLIKIGPVGNDDLGTSWDEKGCRDIIQILISHDNAIRSLQFQYLENGNLVLSDKYGGNRGRNFDVVKFDHPREYLYSVSGSTVSTIYKNGYLSSITFTTNLETYGPYGDPQKDYVVNKQEFCFLLGNDKQFSGFFGRACCNCMRSIGVYMKPIRSFNIEQNQEQNGNTGKKAECIEVQLPLNIQQVQNVIPVEVAECAADVELPVSIQQEQNRNGSNDEEAEYVQI